MNRHETMHARLQARGIIPGSEPASENMAAWYAETGHHFYVMHSPGYGWALHAVHMGDPASSGLSIPLGHDDETAASRVAAEMRHPETVGHLRDMWLRASLNNDPTGRDPRARRMPTGQGDWISLDHYAR